MTQELVEQIYECSFMPECWGGVLQNLASIVGARGGAFLLWGEQPLKWTASAPLLADVDDYLSGGWRHDCPRSKLWFKAGGAGFVVESDLWPAEQLDSIPLYSDFLRPRGLGWSAGLAIELATSDNILFSLERNYDEGPIDSESLCRLNAVRPHLARSALLATRMQLERARAATETLALLGLPALVFNEKGVVLAANALAAEATALICWQAHGRIALRDRRADALLRAALAAGAAACSFPLRDESDAPAMIAHICPIHRSARDIFAHSAAVLILTPVSARQAPPVELLRSMFDLTPAEARVARCLAGGETIDDIATSGGVAASTVRTHVRGVLEKTGCSRQAEVVALLSGLTPLRR
jgi:DNA-binding CsgD family transcriptional regulator